MSPTFKILLLFLIWRLSLVLILLYAVNFISLGSTDRFLGGGPFNYQIAPELFSWANFDGEHYLSIAIFGYKEFEQAFFPVYPMLIALVTNLFISFFAKPFSIDLLSLLLNSTMVGLLISNASFALALLLLFKLISLDFPKKIAITTIIILLLFPTSFYFGSVYNESLFLLLSVSSFYFARKKRWLLSSIFGFIASATRVFGFLLLPALVIEAYQQRAKFSKTFWLILIPLGLILYMLYQYLTVGDPFAFYNLQERVGEQHQKGITLLPQVYYRYIKILLTVDYSQPIYQTIILEFATGILFFLLPIYGIFKKIGSKRIRLSYLVFALLGFLLPTIQGSFSSLPRYVIVLFPSFLAAALWINNIHKSIKIIVYFSLILMLFLETTLFLRGYWVA